MHAERTFEPRPEAVTAARRFVAQTLAGWHVGHPDVALLVSELATNAVLHARSDFEVSVEARDDRLRVGVFDRNPRLPTPANVPPDAYSGRGLMIVQGLADAWGVETHAGAGKTIWFELFDAGRLGADWPSAMACPAGSGGCE